MKFQRRNQSIFLIKLLSMRMDEGDSMEPLLEDSPQVITIRWDLRKDGSLQRLNRQGVIGFLEKIKIFKILWMKRYGFLFAPLSFPFSILLTLRIG